MSLYYELFNQSGRPLAIENCHQGLNFTDGGNPTDAILKRFLEVCETFVITLTLTLTLTLTRSP